MNKLTEVITAIRERTFPNKDIQGIEVVDRGIDFIARTLNKTTEEIERIISGNDVLDLGGGAGLFAKEIYIRKRLDPSYLGPNRIDTMNVRFSKPDYADSPEIRNNPTNIVKFSDQEITVPVLGSNVEDPNIKSALDDAESDFLAMSWFDLNTLPADSYDVIFSIFGFPYNSSITSLSFITGKYEEKISERDINVFRGIGHILKPGGVAYLTLSDLSITYEYWQKDSYTKTKVLEALAEFGCNLEYVEGSDKWSTDYFLITKEN